MLKRNKWYMIIGVTAFLIIPPIVLNLLYPPHKLWISVWSPGELLSYIGSVIIGSATVYLAYRANEMNRRILDNDIRRQKAFVNFSKDDCSLKRVTDTFNGYILEIGFKNITDMPIVGAVAYRSDRIGVDGDWGEKNTTSSKMISIDRIKPLEISDNYVRMRNIIKNKELDDYIFSMELELTSIYRLKTKQLINIRIINGNIYETCIIGE